MAHEYFNKSAVKMIKLTCLCVLLLGARTLAQDEEKKCCPPEQYLSLNRVSEQAVCFILGSNESTPISINCEYGFSHFDYKSFVFKNGEVNIIPGDDYPSYYNIGKYCVNNMYNNNKKQPIKWGIVCYDPPEVEGKITAYLLIVSAVFLIVTVIIYSAFPELRDLYGKSFINLCGSLAIGFIIFATISLNDTEYDDMAQCAAKGFLAYYFLLTSFFWTTAISIQLLLRFRSSSPYLNQSWRTFIWYAIFAWGCPAVITICMAIVNFHPGDHAKPGIGIRSCWFDYEERPQIWYWFYSVLTILTSINTVIFVYIYLLFCRIQFASRQRTTLKSKFCLALKIYGVMGLYWILELLAELEEENNKQTIWIILTYVTSLQGLWIFLTWVVFRKRVIKAMYQRGWLECISGLVEKYLKNTNELDDETVEHTTVPMQEQSQTILPR